MRRRLLHLALAAGLLAAAATGLLAALPQPLFDREHGKFVECGSTPVVCLQITGVTGATGVPVIPPTSAAAPSSVRLSNGTTFVFDLPVSQGDGATAPGVAWSVAPRQGPGVVSSQTTGAADTAVTVTIAALANTKAHVYSVEARCSAGTASLNITDGGTTIWSTSAASVTTTNLLRTWPVGLTAAVNSAVVITLTTCGALNTGTLIVQADQF